MSTATKTAPTQDLALDKMDVQQGRVLTAMSGGVDSSVTAALLHRAGFEVIGATIKTFCDSRPNAPINKCCGLEGISDAKVVAAREGFRHFVYNAEQEFAEDVVENFVSEYAEGRTPIPCVRCNSFTKFRDLLKRADDLGCRYMATGHYARIRRDEDGNAAIYRAEDDQKDQTYFLWGIPERSVHRLVLPVGEVTKDRVREIARELDLQNADKPDSYEICFVPDNDYRGVLRRYLGEDHPALSPGKFITTEGEVVGTHSGYADFTVGQRKGLPGGFDKAMYVIEIRPDDQQVVIGPEQELQSSEIHAGKPNWIATRPEVGETVGVRIRHGAPVVDATVQHINDDEFVLEAHADQRAITPGQSAVVYRDRRLLGGGVIL